MPRFQFRMQKLLDHRHRLEAAAKEAYLLARSRRLTAEEQLERMILDRSLLSLMTCSTLPELVQKEAALTRMENEEAHMKSAIAILLNEEEGGQKRYLEAKRDAEAIGKLRERALDLWQKEENKREQAEIDEWAVTRRAA